MPKKVDDRDLREHRLPQPAIVRGFRVVAHERVVDELLAGMDLRVDAALVIIPNPSARAREDGSDAQKVLHPARLEDAPLRIDQRDALAQVTKAGTQIL